MAGLREALGQLHVEAVQAADVGQDHDVGPTGRLGGFGERRGEARTVGGDELQRLGRRASGQRRKREIRRQVGRVGVDGEAHV
jgi:hypothetical protein